MLSKFFDVESITHSVKTLIATMIGFLIALIVGYPSAQWILITIVVVMCAQIYVGSVIQRAYYRFLGTLIGCLVATIALIVFGNSNTTIAITIGLTSFFFSYLAISQEKFGYAGTLGAVTTVIIMINPNPTLTIAAHRFLEISIGSFIATLVSQFVLPIHARKHLRRIQANALVQLKEYYSTLFVIPSEEFNYQELDEAVVKSILKQRQLAKESANEPLGKGFDPKLFVQFLYYEREILRSITFMHNALKNLRQLEPQFIFTPALSSFNESIIQVMTALIQTLSLEKCPPISLPSYKNIKAAFENEKLSYDANIYLHSFIFSAELLVKNLTHLCALYHLSILLQEPPSS